MKTEFVKLNGNKVVPVKCDCNHNWLKDHNLPCYGDPEIRNEPDVIVMDFPVPVENCPVCKLSKWITAKNKDIPEGGTIYAR